MGFLSYLMIVLLTASNALPMRSTLGKLRVRIQLCSEPTLTPWLEGLAGELVILGMAALRIQAHR
jgi:hypothetical protein